MKKAGTCCRIGCDSPACLVGHAEGLTCIEHGAPSEMLSPPARDLAAEKRTKRSKKHFRAVLAYHNLQPIEGE